MPLFTTLTEEIIRSKIEAADKHVVLATPGVSIAVAQSVIDVHRNKFYKDVTYETLKNKEFADRVMNEIPRSVLEGALLQEGVAVQAARSS